jgi:hypothetical protein
MGENKHFKAKEGFTYKRIVDDFIMGNELYLGKFIDDTDDVIENYIEVEDPEYKSKQTDEPVANPAE